MRLDIEDLRVVHPKLPEATAAGYAEKAAHALQRRHTPPATLRVSAKGEDQEATLMWKRRPSEDAWQLDRKRVTEDGAEAVALALIHALDGWTVSRRLQARQYGDWLLTKTDTGERLVFEVGGTDRGSARALLRDELEQVRRSSAALQRAACVVRFVEPRALVQWVQESEK